MLNIRNNGKKKNTGFVLEESRIDYYGKEIITYDVNIDFISDHLEEFIKFLVQVELALPQIHKDILEVKNELCKFDVSTFTFVENSNEK